MEEILHINKIYKADCITLDGRMDEPVWDEVPTYSDFRFMQSEGGELQKEKTYFKIIACEDRVYFGIKCMEPEQMQECLAYGSYHSINDFNAQSVNIFIAPTGNGFEDYHFNIGWFGQRLCKFYSEAGTIEPDPYAPAWRAEVYTGEDYWSTEVEIPLTAFYMTPNTLFSDKWLINVCRTRMQHEHTTWCPVKFKFNDAEKFQLFDGFPIRPVENDVRICSAVVELEDQNDAGYKGTMTVKVINTVPSEFEFTSDHGESMKIFLDAGETEFKTPCLFENVGITQEMLCVKRLSDGVEFKRYFPVRTSYEPVKIVFTTPEFRGNFYPGQDYTKVVGKIITRKPVTVKIEGPGIETQVCTPGADGLFTFETPNFEEGEGWVTATIDGYEAKRKVRRLAPTGHTMAWISNGNIVCDGETVIPRHMFGTYYLGSEPFKQKYDTEEQYITKKFWLRDMEPEKLVRGSGGSGGEITMDGMPSEEMKKAVDEVIERYKDEDYTHYYIGDEPECRSVSPVYLKNLFEYIVDKDPYHLVMMASREPMIYIDAADWFQAHPYIVPYNNPDGTRTYTRPNHLVGNYVDNVAKLNLTEKCIGFLPTCYTYQEDCTSGFDYPTLDEYLMNAWGGMMHGGKSLWGYAYRCLSDRPHLYEGTKFLFSSFQALDKLVLFGKRTILTRSELTEAMLYEYEDEKMFVLVNFTQQPQTVTLDAITGKWYAFRHKREVTSNTFTLHPFETLICTNTMRDQDLPTYDEVVADIAEKEYARTHTGSKLFKREDDITIASSTSFPVFFPFKMFDGVRDNYSIKLQGCDNPFLEVNIERVNASCNKVVIYGGNMGDVTLKIKVNGEWTTPEIVDFAEEQYCRTFILKDTITPEVLRFEFSQRIVEIYEVEVF